MSAPIPPPQSQPQQQYPPQQYPPQGYPPQGYPPQGYPPQPYPQQQQPQMVYMQQPQQVQQIIANPDADPVYDNAPAPLKYIIKNKSSLSSLQIQVPLYGFVGVVLLAYASDQCNALGIGLFDGFDTMGNGKSSGSGYNNGGCTILTPGFPYCGITNIVMNPKLSYAIEALIGILLICMSSFMGIAYGICACVAKCQCVPFCCADWWARDRILTYGQPKPKTQAMHNAQVVPAISH